MLDLVPMTREIALFLRKEEIVNHGHDETLRLSSTASSSRRAFCPVQSTYPQERRHYQARLPSVQDLDSSEAQNTIDEMREVRSRDREQKDLLQKAPKLDRRRHASEINIQRDLAIHCPLYPSFSFAA